MLEKESVVSINQDLAGANNKDEVVSILSQHGLKIVGDKTGKAYTISFVELDNMPLRNAYLEAKPAGGGGDFHYSLRSKKIRPMKPHDRRRIDKIMGPYTEEVDV